MKNYFSLISLQVREIFRIFARQNDDCQSPFRRQAVLRAMDYFRVLANIRDIARTISRTAWRSVIKEDDVEKIVWTIPDIECIDGKYILRKKWEAD